MAWRNAHGELMTSEEAYAEAHTPSLFRVERTEEGIEIEVRGNTMSLSYMLYDMVESKPEMYKVLEIAYKAAQKRREAEGI